MQYKDQDTQRRVGALLQADAVQDYRDWPQPNPTRTYITLDGHQRNWRGCKTSKVYVDAQGRLRWNLGKGMAPDQWHKSLQTLLAAARELEITVIRD